MDSGNKIKYNLARITAHDWSLFYFGHQYCASAVLVSK